MTSWFRNTFGKKDKEETPDNERDYPKFTKEMSNHEKWVEYFYPSTYNPLNNQGVLRNKRNAKDDLLFNIIEERAATKNMKSAQQIKGEFDIEHLKDIHKELFKDVYAWAGQGREVTMYGKDGGNYFKQPKDFDSYTKEIFDRLKDQNFLEDHKKDKKEFTEKLVDTYLDINTLHYFREGNGRAQNVFIDQLAKHNGYELNLSEIALKEKETMKDDFYSRFDEVDKGNKQPLIDFFHDKLQEKGLDKMDNLEKLQANIDSEFLKYQRADDPSYENHANIDMMKERNTLHNSLLKEGNNISIDDTTATCWANIDLSIYTKADLNEKEKLELKSVIDENSKLYQGYEKEVLRIEEISKQKGIDLDLSSNKEEILNYPEVYETLALTEKMAQNIIEEHGTELNKDDFKVIYADLTEKMKSSIPDYYPDLYERTAEINYEKFSAMKKEPNNIKSLGLNVERRQLINVEKNIAIQQENQKVMNKEARKSLDSLSMKYMETELSSAVKKPSPFERAKAEVVQKKATGLDKAGKGIER